jgi:hypothetical protein
MHKNKSKKNNNTYSMPVKFNPKNHIMFIIQVIYLNLGAFAFDYIFLFYKGFMRNLDINTVLLIVPLIFLFSFYALYLTIDLIDSVFLNKQYGEINYDGIVIKKLFKKVTLKWEEIYSVERYLFRMANTIRITLEKDIRKNKYLRTFGTWFGLFYVDINNFRYKNIDIKKFINTVGIYIK